MTFPQIIHTAGIVTTMPSTSHDTLNVRGILALFGRHFASYESGVQASIHIFSTVVMIRPPM